MPAENDTNIERKGVIMGYVAVKGGSTAIEESIKRLKYERIKAGKSVDVYEIKSGMRGLIDQIMSESSIYNEFLASVAIRQAEGNPEEAVFLLRAYRSTLPRKHYSRIIETSTMRVERRISSSFKDIPGGQILGASYDYTHRLIDFDLINENLTNVKKWLEDYENDNMQITENNRTDMNKLPKISEYLRSEGLIAKHDYNDQEPDDITKESIQFPSSRSQRLQVLTRGQTGAVTALGYAMLRGYGASIHPTVGELRVGYIPVSVSNPFDESCSQEDSYYLGEIKVTEVETLIPVTVEKSHGIKDLEFNIGYGICYGQNETKAIAMSLLDHCLENPDKKYPTTDEEFVLLHIDSIESTGFISHLKLPHYVTFQSKLDSMRKTKVNKENNSDSSITEVGSDEINRQES